MTPLELSGNSKLVLAVLAGIVWGAVLYKSGFADAQNIRSALRLKNGRILKTVLCAMGLGTLAFFGLRLLGAVDIQVRTGYLWGAIFGGVFCGVGLVLCGFASTTVIGALGSGRWYGLWTLLGMILAIPAVNFITEILSKTVYSWQKMGSPATPKEFLDFSNPVLYVVLGMAVLLVLVHFTVGDKEE